MSEGSDYGLLLEGLHDCFLTLSAFDRGQLLKHSPSSVQTSPLLYSMLQNYEKHFEGNLVVETFTTLHRVCIAWQDHQTAEDWVIKLVTEIPDSVERDDRLSGKIRGGRAIVNFGRSGFARIAEMEFRVLDFTSTIINKRPKVT
jgi:hypothetical protein